MKSKDRGDRKKYILAGLILVLTISIGYLGISNVKDTYAVPSCSGKFVGNVCCPAAYSYDVVTRDGSTWCVNAAYSSADIKSGNILQASRTVDTKEMTNPSKAGAYTSCIGGTYIPGADVYRWECKGISGVLPLTAVDEKKCFHCTGQASNGNYYQWATQPEGTCNGGNWQILNNVTNSQNCKASTVTYKCFHCTGQASNGNYYQWATQPEGTCSGGSWITLDKVTSSSSCNATASCAHTTKSSCESANSGYNCVADSKGCYVKGTAKSKCTYTTKNSCESANKGYSCVARGSDDYGNTCYKIANNITYTIKFNANEGTGTTKEVKCTYGSNCTLTANAFTRDGYEFNGWNTKRDGTGISYSNKEIVKNLSSADGDTITLYAKWNKKSSGGVSTKTYTIKFNANEGTGTTKEVKCTYGSNCTLTANAFTRDGYKFNGWNTKNDGSGLSYADKAIVKDLSSTDGATITLYAKWKLNNAELNTHKIIFVHNDGTQTSTTLTIDEDDTVPVITPTRDGFTFDGWYTDSELTKKYDFTTQVKDDFTLYAKWNDSSSSNDKTDEEITENSKTGDVLMFIAWTIGFGALAFSIYYYKTRKETL